MENIESVKVDEILMRYLELLHFEINGLKSILKKIAIKPRDLEYYEVDIETKQFYLDKFSEVNKEYESVKVEIVNEYVPKNMKNMKVDFDFENLVINLYERGNCSC